MGVVDLVGGCRRILRRLDGRGIRRMGGGYSHLMGNSDCDCCVAS